MDNCDLSAAQQGSSNQETNAVWQILMDEIDQGVLWVDSTHKRIVDANCSAERLLGLQRTALFGRTLQSLIVNGGAVDLFGHQPPSFKDTLRTYQLNRADGSTFPAECRQVRAGALDAFLIRDVSNCYHLERALSDSEQKYQGLAERAHVLARCSARLQGQGDLAPILNDFCQEISQLLGWPVVSVALPQEDGGPFRLVASCGLNDDYGQAFDAIGYEVYERHLAEHGDLLVIEDIQAVSGVANLEVSRRENIRSVLVVILHQENQVLGVLSAGSKGAPVTMGEEHVSLMRAFGDLATVAVQRQRYLHQVLDASKRLRAMSRRLIEVQEKESQRLARELHDEIGQNLTFLKIMLEMLPENLSPEMKQKGASSKEIVSMLICQIRALAMDLRPSLLDDLGLVHALLAYFERLEMSTGIRVEFAHSRIARRYSSEIETTVYRVVQEALSNVARHARVKEAWVRIWESQGDLYFQVEDAGAGFSFEPAQYHRSFGLLGMRERVELCNGSLEIDSQPGQGTRITAWLPLIVEGPGEVDYGNLDHPRG